MKSMIQSMFVCIALIICGSVFAQEGKKAPAKSSTKSSAVSPAAPVKQGQKKEKRVSAPSSSSGTANPAVTPTDESTPPPGMGISENGLPAKKSSGSTTVPSQSAPVEPAGKTTAPAAPVENK